MTLKEKKVQIALGTYLPYIWKERKKLRDKGRKLIAEGNKLRDEGYKLIAEGCKLTAKGDKLIAEGDKLRDEGDKLLAEGNLLYINAVIEVYGNKAVIIWETGEVKHD